MLNYELLRAEGILILRPEMPLESSDFRQLATEIDPYIEADGKLHGLMIDANSFPGWKDFNALAAHLKFVRDHHQKVERVAVVSDSELMAVAPVLASHFLKAEMRHFPHSQRDEALRWLREAQG